ncbi:MAG TPA: PDZ domain-containing protein [Polyangia bacterium]
MTLDYAHRRLRLQDAHSFETTLTGVAVNLASKQPYIETTLTTQDGRRIAASLEVDTGKLDPLSLTAAFARQHGLLGDTRALLPLKGVSLGGETQAWLTRAGALEFAGTTVKTPLLGIAEDAANRDGQLGYETLRRFTITFDYAHEKLYFAPNAAFAEPFEFDHAGMIIGAAPPDFRALTIFVVVADTPAARMGLQSGDTILSVDGRPATEFTVDDARRYFQHATGDVKLIIKRQNRDIAVSVSCHSLV